MGSPTSRLRGVSRPNVLLVMTDQLRYPPPSSRRSSPPATRALPARGSPARPASRSPATTRCSAPCAPSRASLLTGHYPSLHGVTQTDGLSKSADSHDMLWLAPDTVPTLGDWFRAGGYRTFYKGKWHASHAPPRRQDGDGYLLVDRRTTARRSPRTSPRTSRPTCSTTRVLRVGRARAARARASTTPARAEDPSPADETIDLLQRLDAGRRRRAVADRLLVPQPARRRILRAHRPQAGAAVPPRTRPARRAVADAR